MNKGIGAAYRQQWRQGARLPTRYPCRCAACGRRRNLTRSPDAYTRAPKCCGERQWRVDWYRMAAEWRAKPCRCDEYSFPHAQGRGFCKHNAAVTMDDRRERWESKKWA